MGQSILSFEMIIKFHQAHKTHRSILKTSWKNPANILRTSRKHQEDIYRISRENPKTSVIIWKHKEHLKTSEHILNTSENLYRISVINWGWCLLKLTGCPPQIHQDQQRVGPDMKCGTVKQGAVLISFLLDVHKNFPMYRMKDKSSKN